MRASFSFIPALFLAGSAFALGLQPPEVSGTPVTTGAIMEIAKIMVRLPEKIDDFSDARILSDDEIAALITSQYPVAEGPSRPAIMSMTELAIGATQ